MVLLICHLLLIIAFVCGLMSVITAISGLGYHIEGNGYKEMQEYSISFYFLMSAGLLAFLSLILYHTLII